MPDNEKAIILFDGVCNFCNSSVNFVIKHDKKNHFLFAPLQSETSKKLLEKFNIDSSKTDSFILIEKLEFYYKDNFVTLTIDDDLEEILGQIELWSGYNNLVLDIMKKVIPSDEILGRLDEIDFSGFFDEE